MPASRPAPDLAPRRAPPQRARETVDRLLDAAAELLEEEGLESLTTNKIAARAGANISSLYKFFPNKHAVLRVLAERNQERQRVLIQAAIERNDQGRQGFRVSIDDGIDAFVAHFQEEPANAAPSNAIRVSPALNDLDTAGNPALVRLVSEGLRSAGVRGSDREIRSIARVVVEAGSGVIDATRDAGAAERKRMIAGLKEMLGRYLAGLVEDD